MRTQGRRLEQWCGVVVLAIVLAPRPAAALSLTLRDVVDPVPPGGIITYTVRVNNEDGTAGVGNKAVCFNPPPECSVSLANCSPTTPACVGNSFTGFVCSNAANDGANCGVGDPPIPNLTLCVPLAGGTCEGGINAGLTCNSNNDCPGNTCVCQHAFNEGAFCCTNNPPTPDDSLCLRNPTGICSAGPNVGLPCTAPNGTSTPQCPDPEGGTNMIDVTLPIPSTTGFINGTISLAGPNSTVTNDANSVAFSIPPPEQCGIPGTTQCPLLTATMKILPTTPFGTIIENQATATTFAGVLQSIVVRTTVQSIALKRVLLVYPNKPERDRFLYRATLTLPADAVIDPFKEPFRIQVESPDGTILDRSLDPGQLAPFSETTQRFKSRVPGLSRVQIRLLKPSHYSLKIKARKLNLPIVPITDPTITVTITLGDDVISQTLPMAVRNEGRKFINLK